MTGVPCSSVPLTMQDVVAPQPVVAGEDVGGHAEAGHVADVARAVRIRPADGDEDLLCQLLLLRYSETGP